MEKKRRRSYDGLPEPQNKYFVNQQLVNQLCLEKMKVVFDKTLNLLYNGQKSLWNIKRKEHIDSSLNSLKVDRQNKDLKCCSRPSLKSFPCKNCCLKICENCSYNCVGCKDFLCELCVGIFDCGSKDNPCCESCKMFL